MSEYSPASKESRSWLLNAWRGRDRYDLGSFHFTVWGVTLFSFHVYINDKKGLYGWGFMLFGFGYNWLREQDFEVGYPDGETGGTGE